MSQPQPCYQPRCFSLIPFADSPVQLTGTLVRSAQSLTVGYLLQAPAQLLAPWQKPPQPRRLDELWQQTCFEVFLGLTGHENYWEINLTPGGNWNCYEFTGYRQGMREEAKIRHLATTTLSVGPSAIAAALTLDLTSLGLSNQDLRLAISTVVLHADGHHSYFALNHPEAKPNFHHPNSFLLPLPAPA